MKIIDIKCNDVDCGYIYYETCEIKENNGLKYYYFFNGNFPVYTIKVELCRIVNKGSYDELIIENRGN